MRSATETVKNREEGIRESSSLRSAYNNALLVLSKPPAMPVVLTFGGLTGILIVDPATGGMWTLDTNELDVTLETAKKTLQMDSLQLDIALLNDVPIGLRHKMVKISE